MTFPCSAGCRAAGEEQLQPVWTGSGAEPVCTWSQIWPRTVSQPVGAGTESGDPPLGSEAGGLYRWMDLQHWALPVDFGHWGTELVSLRVIVVVTIFVLSMCDPFTPNRCLLPTIRYSLRAKIKILFEEPWGYASSLWPQITDRRKAPP